MPIVSPCCFHGKHIRGERISGEKIAYVGDRHIEWKPARVWGFWLDYKGEIDSGPVRSAAAGIFLISTIEFHKGKVSDAADAQI